MTKEFNHAETVRVFRMEQYDGEWMPTSLEEAVAWLQSKLDEVPEEYRSTARVEIDSVSSWEGNHYARIEITYERPPTPEEVAERRAQALADAERDAAWVRQRADESARRIAALKAAG